MDLFACGELLDDPPSLGSLPAFGSAFGDQGYGGHDG
jgi:hypothetical protein